MINIFSYQGYDFTLTNLILISSVIIIWFIIRRWINKKLVLFLKKKGWFISGKEQKTNKLLKQVLFIIFFILGVKALSYGHPNFSFSDMLDLEIFGFSTGLDSEGLASRFSFTLGNLAFVIMVILISKFFISAFKIILHKTTKTKSWIDEGRRYTILQLTKYIIYTIAIIIAIQGLGVNITFLIASSAALFVGIGLGLQFVLGDIFSGIILLFDGTIKVGDIIEMPKNNEIARVQNIYIRTSQVITLDGKHIILPNSILTKNNVVNLSISEKSTRFHIDVGVAYGTDTQNVKDILYECALQHPIIDKRKNIVVMLDDFGDFSLKFKLYFWLKDTWEIINVKSDLRYLIDQQFRENNIKIPFPQRDLHIISDFTKKKDD